MRVIHLCFQLHEPFGLQKFSGEPDHGYFESKAEFERTNAEVYQPLFAFLERTTQKFRAFRFSLVVSGPWLELAERYDNDLIERLRKLVKLGQVELVVEPWYHSLAFFYDKGELAEQVKLYREKIQKLFGVEGRIFVLPEFIYCDQVGKWAEDFGFAGMLVGGNTAVLGWHSPNHVYEAMECRYLRLLFQNTVLARMVNEADPELLVEKRVSEDSDEKKLVLSAQKFQKCLDLEMLRGGLVNLYFDAEVFRKQRGRGVIGFFDDLVAGWLEVRGNHFAGAAQACVAETPTMAISVKESVSWREDTEEVTEKLPEATGIMVRSEVEALPPRWLSNAKQVELSKALYGLKREILASEDERVIEDWRRLTALDYLKNVEQENFRAVLADLKTRAEKAKKAQAVEISRAYTKKHDRGNIDVRPAVDSTVVQVNFGAKRVTSQPKPMRAVSVVEADDNEVMVRGLSARKDVVPVEAEVAEIGMDEVARDAMVTPAQAKASQATEKPRGIRKVIRRLVIE